MAVQSRRQVISTDGLFNTPWKRFLVTWLLLSLLLVIVVPNLIASALRPAFHPVGEIAPLFTPEIDYWGADIKRWSKEYGVDPNMLATIMQIESCGHPNISSYAGAQGLFQVMPFHFSDGENQIDPNTNARRGANFMRQCTEWANGDLGLALACYNGGPSILQKPYHLWSDQTQRYYKWGTGIYADAILHHETSTTLDAWLNAGGSGLCSLAAAEIGLQSH